eukprot:CAMPEP_0194124960 /NCGR_PEP_ID=MMETSP0150-20130528/59213_1 /TAXON_ID=122233 /ORGANISM="Chaetoceros debilis, Strain MM31A-1" /LENGTH=512 /DNA_ID=CAMNT_0038818745 /DNA_START=41 /DNA_END=1579 /DNA_ORIENTATION=-
MKIRRTAPSIPSLPPLSLHNGRPSTLHWKYASPSQTNQKTELLEMIQVIRDSLTKGWSLSRALGLKHGMGMGMGIGIGMGHQKKLDQLKELEERIRGMHNERLEAIMVNSAMQSSRGGIGMCGAGLGLGRGRGRMGSYQAVAKNHISSAMKFLDATTSSLRSDMGTFGSLSARDNICLESTRSGDFDMQVFIEFDNYDGEGSACSCICVGLDDSGSVSMSLLSDGESYSDNFGRNKKSEREKCECDYSNDDLLSEGSGSKTGSGSGSADTGRTASQTNSSTDSTPVPSSPSTSTSSIGMEDLELNVTTSHFRSNHNPNPNLDVGVDVTPISGDDDDDDPTIRSTDGMEELGISITTWSSIDLSASQKEKNNNTNSDRNSSAVVDSPGISRRKQFAQRCEKSLQDHESDRKKDNDNINLTNSATAEMNNDDDNDNDNHNENHNDDNHVKEVKIQERERIEEVAVSIGDITVRATRTKRVRFSGVKPTMDENLNRARDILASYNNLSNYWEQGK